MKEQINKETREERNKWMKKQINKGKQRKGKWIKVKKIWNRHRQDSDIILSIRKHSSSPEEND